MGFFFADMHSDTLTELYLGGFDIADAPLHVSLDAASALDTYVQSAAIWTDASLTDDEAYTRFSRVLDHFERSASVQSGSIRLCRNTSDIDKAVSDGVPAYLLSIEGARLLGERTLEERFLDVTNAGVWLITLQWSGTDCIGGAWDTSSGLTETGARLLSLMAQRGTVCDLSHASDAEISQVLNTAESLGLAVCASHSNSRAVCPHRRNLTDDNFKRIAELGGTVGISMAPSHLAASGNAAIDDICRHLEHYLELGGENVITFGCDFDGVSSLPCGIGGLRDIPHLRDCLAQHGFSDDILDRIFFKNAMHFIEKHVRSAY